MQKLIINGGKRLEGSISIHGAKNSVLPLIAATVLSDGKSVLHNCPDLSDVDAALDIVGALGLTYKKNGSDIEIISKQPSSDVIPDELMRSMRSSIMFLGAILARCRRAVITLPGGCRLGPRPIDIHIKALKRLGASVKESNGRLEFSAARGLNGADVYFRFPSVGATENTVMAAVTAKGITRIFGAAREPEIKDLADFLNKSGARISGAGTGKIVIKGVPSLYSAEHTVIPDRIEAATYMAAAAITGGFVTLKNVNAGHLTAINRALTKCGCEIAVGQEDLTVLAPLRLYSPGRIETGVYPAFPTDAGPLLISVLSSAYGTSFFSERVFKNRYGFIKELNKLGTDIKTRGLLAVIRGRNELYGATVNCTDLRGGAALIIAALKARGQTVIGDLCHIMRGYEDIAGNLKTLGADITEI